MSSRTSAVVDADEVRARVEAEIVAWAGSDQGRRLYEKYRDRRAYNQEICHRLAAAGVPPLAAAVLRLGRWGQSGSVAEDVASWYAGLAQRLAEQESAIPLPVRRQANDLVESLWKLAGADVDQRLVEPLREELAERDKQLDESRQKAQTLSGQLTLATREVERLLAEQAVSNAAVFDQRRLIAATEQALADAKLVHARELATLRQQHAQDVAVLHDQNSQITTQLRQQLDAEVARANGERTALLHRVDQAQVEARQWMAKGEEAQVGLQRALAELGDAKASTARTQGELALSRAAEARLSDELAAAVKAGSDAAVRGVSAFLAQLSDHGLRLVRDLASSKTLAKPEWMPTRDWEAQVIPLVGGTSEDGQRTVLLELLAGKAKPRGRMRK